MIGVTAQPLTNRMATDWSIVASCSGEFCVRVKTA